jgi:NADPH:quinone reductase-like Zn-dependent oxidoreductase
LIGFLCRSEKIRLDTSNMKEADVFVRMLASPITRFDIACIRGSAGQQSSNVAGNEGVGIVEEAGSASGLSKGDVVAVSRPGIGRL